MTNFLLRVVLAPFWILMGDFSWIGSVAQAKTSEKNAETQASAARAAADVQSAASAAAQAQQLDMFNQQQKNAEPWLAAGTDAVNRLRGGLSAGGQFSNTPQFNFDPSSVNLLQDPGYQFRVKTGQDALTAGSAAQGGYGSGNLGVALTQYGQDLGSQEYGAAYNRAYSNALDEYDAAMNSQNTVFNRLSGVAGTGQTAMTNLGNQGMATAANVGSLLTGSANAQATGMLNSALAQAQGRAGIANAISGASASGGNSLMGGLSGLNYYQNYQNQMQNQAAYNNYGVNPVDYGGGGVSQGTDMYAGDLY